MSVYKRQGQAVYSYDFRYRRQRFSGSTGCTSRREAEQFEARERKRIEGLILDATKPLDFAAASARYWNEVGQFHRNSAETLRALDWLESHVGGASLLMDISDATIAALVARRRGGGVGPATVNRGVCEPMRAILRRAGRVWKQPVQDIEWKRHFLREPQERIREASAAEEHKLLAAMRGDYAPALRFAILTGCRRAEIVGLTWAGVDFFNREFTVHGKGDRKRTLPMTLAVHDLLWSLKDDHREAVFTYVCRRPAQGRTKGRRYPVTIEGFKTAWRRAVKRAEVDNFRFHDTRHTAATRLVRATGNLKLAQEMLGHTEITTTSRYAHVTKDDLRAGMEAAQRAAQGATESATDRKTGNG